MWGGGSNPHDPLTILLGNGDGTFWEAEDPPIVENEPTRIATGFFDEDSNLDLAVANFGTDSVSILLGNGDGTFEDAEAQPIAVPANPLDIAIGNFNGDPILDLVVLSELNSWITILLGNGDGTFMNADGSPFQTNGINPTSIAVGNFN